MFCKVNGFTDIQHYTIETEGILIFLYQLKVTYETTVPIKLNILCIYIIYTETLTDMRF